MGARHLLWGLDSNCANYEAIPWSHSCWCAQTDPPPTPSKSQASAILKLGWRTSVAPSNAYTRKTALRTSKSIAPDCTFWGPGMVRVSSVINRRFSYSSLISRERWLPAWADLWLQPVTDGWLTVFIQARHCYGTIWSVLKAPDPLLAQSA